MRATLDGEYMAGPRARSLMDTGHQSESGARKVGEGERCGLLSLRMSLVGSFQVEDVWKTKLLPVSGRYALQTVLQEEIGSIQKDHELYDGQSLSHAFQVLHCQARLQKGVRNGRITTWPSSSPDLNPVWILMEDDTLLRAAPERLCWLMTLTEKTTGWTGH